MIKSIIGLFLLLSNVSTFASDSTYYSCKYRLTSQKDPKNLLSKFNDIMILSMADHSTLFYSYLKQFGNRNFEQYISKNSKQNDENGGIVKIDNTGKRPEFYMLQESEIIGIDYKKKKLYLSDKLLLNEYKYEDTLVSPFWKIGFSTSLILNQRCKMATTTFKGRNYIAWFAPLIPFHYGPWLFNGLPGLILKVEDDKGQFLFECIELNTNKASTSVFKEYSDAVKISKTGLRLKKKLLAENYTEYMKVEEGKTILRDGEPFIQPNKPYNPIDLSGK